MTYILGIDPGLGTTGWCLWIAGVKGAEGYVQSGIVRGPRRGLSLTDRCFEILFGVYAAATKVPSSEGVHPRYWGIHAVVECDTHRPIVRGREHLPSLFVLCGTFLGSLPQRPGITSARLVTSREWRPSSWRQGHGDVKNMSLAQANIWSKGHKRIEDHNEADAVNIAQWAAANWKEITER